MFFNSNFCPLCNHRYHRLCGHVVFKDFALFYLPGKDLPSSRWTTADNYGYPQLRIWRADCGCRQIPASWLYPPSLRPPPFLQGWLSTRVRQVAACFLDIRAPCSMLWAKWLDTEPFQRPRIMAPWSNLDATPAMPSNIAAALSDCCLELLPEPSPTVRETSASPPSPPHPHSAPASAPHQ